eukprot:2137907-Pleurochrysis_carterae.AAC.1
MQTSCGLRALSGLCVCSNEPLQEKARGRAQGGEGGRVKEQGQETDSEAERGRGRDGVARPLRSTNGIEIMGGSARTKDVE